jgi:predicted NUDIX family phosphoesterase
MSSEPLVCFQRTLLEELGLFQGVIPFDPKYLPLLEPQNRYVIPREQAETDPTYKQLVVYFTVEQGNEYLSYWRGEKKGDGRLSGKFTIGFGGHVNADDISPLAAISRELIEEMQGFVTRVWFKGFINDDSNPIGEVHFGLLYSVTLQNFSATSDLNIQRISLLNLRQLGEMYEYMESWSKHVFDYLNKPLPVLSSKKEESE